MTNNVVEIQGELEIIVKELKNLRRNKGKVTAKWVIDAKNPLMGLEYLWGQDYVRALGNPTEHKTDWWDGGNDYQRVDYFENIKYRSKLRIIRDKISYFEQQYDEKLKTLKQIVSNSTVNSSSASQVSPDLQIGDYKII